MTGFGLFRRLDARTHGHAFQLQSLAMEVWPDSRTAWLHPR